MYPRSVDIWAAGVSVVIGGQFFSWNEGLAAGSVSYGVAVSLMGTAYLCLTLSMAEMTSMMPFAGGAYGLGRCTLGFFVGFLLGCCETLEYILYVTCACLTLCRMLADKWPVLTKYKYLVWALTYLVACMPVARGGRPFWMWNRAMAAISLGIILLFCVGSLPFVELHQPAQGDYVAVGGFSAFMKASPQAAWFFVGIESLNTLSNTVPTPQVTVPRGQVWSMVTLLVTAIWTYLVCLFLPPGMPTLSAELSPLNSGFTRMLNISSETATLLAVPATFATAEGFMLSYSNILVAMANSKLLPTVLSRRHTSYGTPVNALASGTLASFILCFVVDEWTLDTIVYDTCILFAFMSYVAQCLGYLFLKKHHKRTARLFVSPFGRVGAAFAIVVWVLNAVAVIAFQQDDEASVISALVLVVLCALYYHLYAKHRQSFSEEEQRILLLVHIAIHNAFKHSSKRRESSKKYTVLSLGGKTSRGSTGRTMKVLVGTTRHVSNVVAVTNTMLETRHGDMTEMRASSNRDNTP
ncbi:hypothetical protein H310_10051 [Aphanomyces invadans]|uniref:Amino acid permease/ SLC12A domain-containing protein n=1 Tax=Aphanomyces invadans TaxID=157072 RepID=A0A024TRU9_9STRA|nr:hypothetical protein H310_10051 [Aphanomyces invadans]ETV96734.1 hypothetical protein H310_10051 [Aphanomyces invadans]|eukprot:XP_008874511.1 hypothetical protein H310_10051 [Aphanomyces invadans]